MRIKVLQFRHGRARLLPSRGVKKRFFFRHALILLGLALPVMMPSLGWGLPSCTCARFNDWKDLGCHQPPGGAGSPPSSIGGKAHGNQSGCKTCPSPKPSSGLAGPDASDTSASSAASTGMPRWWVDEPYINLHVVDEPLSYTTSSGQEMAFRWIYKEHYALPSPDQVPNYYWPEFGGQRFADSPYIYRMRCFSSPGSSWVIVTNAAWSHNWQMNIAFWDQPRDSAIADHYGWGYAVYSQEYEALVFTADGGITYFTSTSGSAPSDPTSAVQLHGLNPDPLAAYPAVSTPTSDAQGIYWGTLTNGFVMTYPDGSLDILGLSIGDGPDPSQTSSAHAFLTKRVDLQGRTSSLGY